MGYGLAFQLFYMEGSVPRRWSMSFFSLSFGIAELIKFAWHESFSLWGDPSIWTVVINEIFCHTVLFLMQQFEDLIDFLLKKKEEFRKGVMQVENIFSTW